MLVPGAEDMHLEQLVVLIEMVIFSVPIHFVAFSWKEFRTPSLPSGVVNRTLRVLKHGAVALSPADLALMTTLNFGQRYETHVLLEEGDDSIQDAASSAQAVKPAPEKLGKKSS